MAQPVPSAQGAIQFQYLAEIAVGNTARIDLCRATAPAHLAGRLFAVKRLHQHIAEDPSFANQFLDEVWMTASLKHPNVVEVAGWGTDKDGMYLAVELVQGVSLARLMKTIFDTGEAFTERMVVYIASRLCRGLAAAHSLRAQNGELLQLVHRDLTPSNIMVGFNGEVKITDFGLAKAKQRLTKTLTGLLKGQPQYMAPEQARGENIDHRTDLFALGVLLFELFAGRKPWLVQSDFDAVHAILTRTPDDLRELRPKIDKELAFVVQRCLEKDPAARFQSANEVLARVDEWLLVHGYQEGNEEALSRFVRRNAMRQMRWFERAIAGELTEGRPEPPRAAAFTGQNPAAVLDGDDDDSEETDLTDVEALVANMHQRAADPATARRVQEDRDFSEEVPTIVQKSGAMPLPPKPGGAPAAGMRPAPNLPAPPPPAAGRPAVKPAPQAPGKPLTPPPGGPGAPGAPRAPAPSAAGARIATPPPPPSAAATAAARAQRPTIPQGATARTIALPDARAVHESLIDEETDARTTAVKTRPRPAARGPLIIPPGRDVSPSMADSESEEIPTLPLQGMPPGLPLARAGPGSPGAAAPPGQLAQVDPRVPAAPGSVPGRAGPPGRDDIEDDWSTARSPLSEDRIMAEADRLALEAVRQADEAKSLEARAERQRTIAKVASDAAKIAAEAVRFVATSGIAEAARRMEDAYSLERSIRRMGGTPLEGSPAAAGPAPPGQRPMTAIMPKPAPSSPGMMPPPTMSAPREAPPSFGAPPPMAMTGPNPALGPQGGLAPPANALQSGMMPMPPGLRQSFAPPPPIQGTGAFDNFEAKLRPTIFGLPGMHVAILAIGTFVLVLILMWILLG